MFVSMELLQQRGLANEEREPCQHLTAGSPCATWIMSSDNESCAKSQHDLWDLLPPPPSPRCVGLAGELGCCVCPLPPCYPRCGEGGTEIFGILIGSLELILDQLRGPAGHGAAGWPCPTALPLIPGALGGRDGSFAAVSVLLWLHPSQISCHAPMGARQALGERGVSTGSERGISGETVNRDYGSN